MADKTDWRADLVTSLASDWTSPWTGVTHLAGSPAAKVTPGRDAARRPLSFVSPSPEALAISLANRAAADATVLRRVVEETAPARHGESWSVDDGDLTQLFDFFEACFVAVTFSFQSIEAFANRVIDVEVKNPFEWTREGTPVAMGSSALQRQVTTETKLAVILPRLLGVPSPKGRAPWEGFRRLKTVRDAVVHIKGDDAYPRNRPNAQSLFHRLLVDGVGHHPRAAVKMIAWFYGNREKPDWLSEAENLVTPV